MTSLLVVVKKAAAMDRMVVDQLRSYSMFNLMRGNWLFGVLYLRSRKGEKVERYD